MNINQLIPPTSYNILLKTTKTTKQIRHVPTIKNWDLIRSGYFEEYQSVQRGDKFNCKYIMSFITDKYDRTIFKGFYEIIDSKEYTKGDLSAICEEAWLPSPELVHYKMKKLNILEELIDRLVIDWGEGKRSWHQWYKDREVLMILPPGYLLTFPGFIDFTLLWNEFDQIFSNKNAHQDWHNSLSNVNGIYLILDQTDGKQYIGSAYGKEGLWGRWSSYHKTKHGNNDMLIKLLKKNSTQYQNFRFSILEVLPKTTLKDEVIAKEQLYKEKFGTRAFGLNLN
jgi:GIY-YIG catalytic domain-containing protein